MTGPALRMNCPWHVFGVEHPAGSPDCALDPDDLVSGRYVPLKDLVAWCVMILNDLVTIQIETSKAIADLREGATDDGTDNAGE